VEESKDAAGKHLAMAEEVTDVQAMKIFDEKLKRFLCGFSRIFNVLPPMNLRKK
jgi:hypothetical protein